MQSVEFTHPQSVYHIRALSLLEDLRAEDATRILLAPSSTHFIVEKVSHVHKEGDYLATCYLISYRYRVKYV